MSDVIEVNSGNLVYKLFIPGKYLSVDAWEYIGTEEAVPQDGQSTEE